MRCQSSHAAALGERALPDCPATCYSSFREVSDSLLDSPFSTQMVSLNCRTALVLPQKFRNFRVWLSAVEFQIT